MNRSRVQNALRASQKLIMPSSKIQRLHLKNQSTIPLHFLSFSVPSFANELFELFKVQGNNSSKYR